MNTAESLSVKRGRATISMAANDVADILLQEINKHPDDHAVDNFAAAMRAKMKYAREVKHREGWDDPAQCSNEHLNHLLTQQLTKGDTVDLANFAMMIHQRGERMNLALSAFASNAPRLGEFWQGEGGFNAGIMRGVNGHPDYHLIVSPDDLGSFKDAQWGCEGKEITGADSLWDGLSNTKAMAAAGSELAKKILSLEIDGHNDFYLFAPKESNLCFANCQDQFPEEWHWTSRQSSAYTAFIQDFEDGGQDTGHKSGHDWGRAVRRKLII